MKNRIYKTLLRLCLKLHNLAYRITTKLAIKAEGGLHPKHRLMNYHQFFVDNVNKDNKVLDIKCGNGTLTFDLTQKAKFVVGIDLSEKNIEVAQKKYRSENIQYRVGDVTKDLDNHKFDVLVLSNVLEHIKDRVGFLKRVKKIAPKVLIRVPLLNRDWITLYKQELGIDWRLDQTHFTEYTVELFKEELENAALSLEKYSIQFGEIWAIVR